MQLLTKEVLARLPKLGTTEHESDPLVQVKFFYPDFSWTWYGIEFDGTDIFFGYVEGDFPELGYFTLSELQENKGKLGFPIERDRFFQPCPLSTLMK